MFRVWGFQVKGLGTLQTELTAVGLEALALGARIILRFVSGLTLYRALKVRLLGD